MPDPSGSIHSSLGEERVFRPVPAAELGFARWHVASLGAYKALHARSVADPEGFWAEQAAILDWFAPWTSVLSWNAPDARWYDGATLNACHNCVDRHVIAGHGAQVGLVWEGEPIGPEGPEVRRLTYRDLQRETARLGNALKRLGVGRGDVVTIYMPMVPELAVAVLACARIGAVHSVIFGGFAPNAIVERMVDASSSVILTADGGFRRGEIVPLLGNVAEACAALAERGTPARAVLALRRTGHAAAADAAASLRGSVACVTDWHAAIDAETDACPCEAMASEDMLFLLYTSGSTGKPKGIVHTTGGYLVFAAMTAKLVFNLIPGDGGGGVGGREPLFWCTADIGWVTGHSYVLYGVMANRVATLMYEGAPNAPANDRFWEIVSRHRVTQLYTAPTAIRTFMKWGESWPERHDLASLRIVGTVGEPINPEAWMWYHAHIGRGHCPVVDTYWQTETGGHVITPMPGAIPTKPGSCTLPMLGIDAAVVNEAGEELPANAGGLLVIRRPWPGMLRGIHGNRERFVQGYFGRIAAPGTGTPGGPAREPYYFSADGARRDADGYFWVMGRVDDVINVSGHRLGTMEVESALVSHPAVAEAAVVGMPHEIKGTGICAFVTLRADHALREAKGPEADALKAALCAHVTKEIGAIARPDSIRFAESLPKTRSGKIMRRLLRDVAAGAAVTQDTTTLEDLSVIARLRDDEE